MNELLIKDFIVPLILLIVGSSFTGAVAVGWWGVQRVVKGQDDTIKKLEEIKDELKDEISGVKERTGQLEAREEMRDKMTEKLHAENRREFHSIYQMLGQKKGGLHG